MAVSCETPPQGRMRSGNNSTCDDGLFRSADAGENKTWLSANSGRPAREFGSGVGPLAIDPQNARATWPLSELCFSQWCYTLRMTMRIEWHAGRNAQNHAKHGVSFELAAHVFDDPNHMLRPDRIDGGWRAALARNRHGRRHSPVSGSRG